MAFRQIGPIGLKSQNRKSKRYAQQGFLRNVSAPKPSSKSVLSSYSNGITQVPWVRGPSATFPAHKLGVAYKLLVLRSLTLLKAQVYKIAQVFVVPGMRQFRYLPSCHSLLPFKLLVSPSYHHRTQAEQQERGRFGLLPPALLVGREAAFAGISREESTAIFVQK